MPPSSATTTATSSAGAVVPPYVNTTLSTRAHHSNNNINNNNGPNLFVNVYLPPGTSSSQTETSDLPYFYHGTRFEGGSMVGPVLVMADGPTGSSNNNNGGDPAPWHLHRNCWKFPYNRECVDDIHNQDAGAERHGHGHRELGIFRLRRDKHHLTPTELALGVSAYSNEANPEEEVAEKEEEMSFDDLLDGGQVPSRYYYDDTVYGPPAHATTRSKAHAHTATHRHMHDHHGGHHPPYRNQHHEYRPDSNYIPGRKVTTTTTTNAESHVLYGNDMWRVDPPMGHDPTWPESGVGLASEFGYGDDGSHCIPTPHRPCGWVRSLATSVDDLDYDDDTDNDVNVDVPVDVRARPLTKIVNGVLGYDEARSGQPFLKIGVGKLIKGSCAMCNGTDTEEGDGGEQQYRFNSPYEFYEEPIWNVVKDRRPYHLVLEHEATLGGEEEVVGGGEGDSDGDDQGDSSNNHSHRHLHHHHHNQGPEFGYRLKKSLRVDGRVLTVTSTLTNLGRDRFATPWYSHHFFTCDGIGVGPAGAYGLDLELRPYVDPATGTVRYDDSPWATPIDQYAETREVKHREEREDSWFDFFSPTWWRKKETRKTTQITITGEVEEGVRIKAEFPNDKGRSKGSFVMHGCGVSVAESIPELQDKLRPSGEAQSSDMSMYAFNLYIEKGTLSPEPLYLIELDGGASITWTQRLEIGLDGAEVAKMSMSSVKEAATASTADILDGSVFAAGGAGLLPILFFVMIVSILYSAIRHKVRRSSGGYEQIPSVADA